MTFFRHCLAALSLLFALCGPPALAAAETLTVLPSIDDPDLRELSGLAPSLSKPGLWWGINDSGNAPRLFAFDESGQVRANVYVAGAVNFDWEDLAAVEIDGLSYLAIADCGDNLSIRASRTIYLVPEPSLEATETAPVRQIDFRFEDGARDCEGLTVDVAGERILLSDKRHRPPALYSLSFGDNAPPPARRIAEFLLNWPQPSPLSAYQAPPWRGQITALDLDRSGRRLLVLTTTHALIYTRGEAEDWPAALTRPPQAVRLPPESKSPFEAAAFSLDGRSVLISGEGRPAPLLRWVPSPP